jgi:hypothetical protein
MALVYVLVVPWMVCATLDVLLDIVPIFVVARVVGAWLF